MNQAYIFKLITICLVILISGSTSFAGIFDRQEVQVKASPENACSVKLENVEKVIDYDVSPDGTAVAALVKKNDETSLIFWKPGSDRITTEWNPAEGFAPRAITWHPMAQNIFISGVQGKTSKILRLEKSQKGWTAKTIYESTSEIRRLLACPSPFAIERDQPEGKAQLQYRIFFGLKNENGTYRTVSVTENGKYFYQAIGPAKTFTHFKDEEDPSHIEASSALPMSFHPAGHELIWEDAQHNLNCAVYDKLWEKSQPFLKGRAKGGSVTPTPNGLALIHWQSSMSGVGVIMLATGNEERQATDVQFVSTPSSVPDGRGIIGLTKAFPQDQTYTLNYVPLNIPLPDVVNAWMFCESSKDMDLLGKNGGLFRNLKNDQLYQLYESENYACGNYEQTLPTRPYLVTTDIFWELFAAAYEGLFIVQEREQAMPAFWKFVSDADQFYKKTNSKSRWAIVFSAISDLKSKNMKNPETARINAAASKQHSDSLGLEVDYAELKPRGHYSSSEASQDYFKAFRYFTSVFSGLVENERIDLVNELGQMPEGIKKTALNWTESYQGFISPSRAPLAWSGSAAKLSYNLHPSSVPSVFPLSWGFDNEILLSTVFHPDWPEAGQIKGITGPRLIASGIDVAAATGSGFADSLLNYEYSKYPPLKKTVERLRSNFETNAKNRNESLYDRWISALAVQWADDAYLPDQLWKAKRLQTGLSSWATLRHATVLVNERTAAECGEGGFEDIILRAPRGYVEPDPKSFAALAELFETAIGKIGKNSMKTPDSLDEDSKASESIMQGITRRLGETAKKARMFQVMAEKEIKGEALTNTEYDEIFHVGRIAEHHFLVFKSLGNKDLALSNPDPIPKIADVAGGNGTPFLMSAVGKPAEWDHVAPFFGRRQILKGSVYSYYEFQSDRLLNDKEWAAMAESQARPSWVSGFFTDNNLSCPAVTKYVGKKK